MRVTNEQIRAEIICTQSDTCEGCPFYGIDECDNLRGNDFDMYKDILEARELIKEMREVLNATRKTYSNEILTLAKMRIEEILEKTKDYV